MNSREAQGETGRCAVGAARGRRALDRRRLSSPAANGRKVVELQKLKDNLYLLSGGGGNSAAFITDLGVVLVDTKLAGWGQPLLDKLKTVTTKPVTTIINTHAHGDHTGSNEFFPTSVEIIAQENTRLNMDKLDAFKGVKVNYLPKLMFKEKMTIGSGKDRVDLYYFGAGHTGGDAWVVFPALRVMHAGDMLASRNRRQSISTTAAAASRFPTRSRKRPPRRRTSTRSSRATVR